MAFDQAFLGGLSQGLSVGQRAKQFAYDKQRDAMLMQQAEADKTYDRARQEKMDQYAMLKDADAMKVQDLQLAAALAKPAVDQGAHPIAALQYYMKALPKYKQDVAQYHQQTAQHQMQVQQAGQQAAQNLKVSTGSDGTLKIQGSAADVMAASAANPQFAQMFDSMAQRTVQGKNPQASVQLQSQVEAAPAPGQSTPDMTLQREAILQREIPQQQQRQQDQAALQLQGEAIRQQGMPQAVQQPLSEEELINQQIEQAKQAALQEKQQKVRMAAESEVRQRAEAYQKDGYSLEDADIKARQLVYPQYGLQPPETPKGFVGLPQESGEMRPLTRSQLSKFDKGESTFYVNAGEAGRQLDDLEKTVQAYGKSRLADEGIRLPFVGQAVTDAYNSYRKIGMTNEQAMNQAKLDRYAYSTAVLYAKLIDPDSVAREGEVAAAKKYMIQMGLLDRPEVALSGIQSMREEIANRVRLRENLWGGTVQHLLPESIRYDNIFSENIDIGKNSNGHKRNNLQAIRQSPLGQALFMSSQDPDMGAWTQKRLQEEGLLEPLQKALNKPSLPQDEQMAEAPSALLKKKDSSEPMSTQPTKPQANISDSIASQIVNWEGRRDKSGNLAVYQLPGNDGGGRYEVAGINERYHPEAARKLAEMPPAEREAFAAQYIKQYTDKAASWTQNPGVEAFLRDTTFNRGQGGAAKILQEALGVERDGKVGPKTLAALKQAEQDPAELLRRLRMARESYEYRVVGKRSNFDKGLRSRWDNAYQYALSLV